MVREGQPISLLIIKNFYNDIDFFQGFYSLSSHFKSLLCQFQKSLTNCNEKCYIIYEVRIIF